MYTAITLNNSTSTAQTLEHESWIMLPIYTLLNKLLFVSKLGADISFPWDCHKFLLSPQPGDVVTKRQAFVPFIRPTAHHYCSLAYYYLSLIHI